MSTLSRRVISGINTAVFVSPRAQQTERQIDLPHAAGASHLGTAMHCRGTEKVLVFPGPPDNIIQVIPSRGQLKASGEESGKITAEAETGMLVPWGWVCPNQWGQLALEIAVVNRSSSVGVHMDEPPN